MTASASLDLVPFGKEDFAWPHLLPYFERIAGKVPYTTVTPDSILERAKCRELMLWRIQQGWCLTGAMATGEMGTTAFVEAIAGDRMTDWLEPCLADLEERYANAGKTKLWTRGRGGWRRVLSRYGYTEKDGGMEKRLNDA